MRVIVAKVAVRLASRRLPKGPRRPLTLGEHFWFTALVTAVVLVLPVAMSVCDC